MTKGEYLQNQIDDCTQKAVAALNKHDIDMVLFFLHARDGFFEKRNVLSVDELREFING